MWDPQIIPEGERSEQGLETGAALPGPFPELDDLLLRYGRSFGDEKVELRARLAAFLETRTPGGEYLLDRLQGCLGADDGSPSAGQAFEVLNQALSYHGSPEWVLETLKTVERTASEAGDSRKAWKVAFLIGSAPSGGRFDAALSVWQQQLQSEDEQQVRVAISCMAAEFDSAQAGGEPGKAEEIMNVAVPLLASLLLNYSGNKEDVVLKSCSDLLIRFAGERPKQFCDTMLQTAADETELEAMLLCSVFSDVAARVDLTRPLVKAFCENRAEAEHCAALVILLACGTRMIEPLLEEVGPSLRPRMIYILQHLLPLLGPEAVDAVLPILGQDDDPAKKEAALKFLICLAAEPHPGESAGQVDRDKLHARLKQDDVRTILQCIAKPEGTTVEKLAAVILKALEDDEEIHIKYDEGLPGFIPN